MRVRQEDEDAKNPGGWIVWVAIADVAALCRPDRLSRPTPVRRATRLFPRRVGPCSPTSLGRSLLVRGEERACLAVRMVFDAAGTKRGHASSRPERSAASLSYEALRQPWMRARGGSAGLVEGCSSGCGPPMRGEERRDRRQPLAIESMERKILCTRRFGRQMARALASKPIG